MRHVVDRVGLRSWSNRQRLRDVGWVSRFSRRGLEGRRGGWTLLLFIDYLMPSDTVKEDLIDIKELEYDADVPRDGKSPQIFQSARQFVRAQAGIKGVRTKDALSGFGHLLDFGWEALVLTGEVRGYPDGCNRALHRRSARDLIFRVLPRLCSSRPSATTRRRCSSSSSRKRVCMVSKVS